MPMTSGGALSITDMNTLDGFDSDVQLSAMQVKALIDRARRLKSQQFGVARPPGAATRPGRADHEVITLRHPVPVLADLITMSEGAGLPLHHIAFCCTGDASSPLAQSLMFAGTALGMDVRLAAPAKFWPTDGAIARAHHLAAANRAGLLITTSSLRAAANAHFLVTVPFRGQATTTVTEAAALAGRPPALRPLSEEQSMNGLWVLEAVLAGWLGAPGLDLVESARA